MLHSAGVSKKASTHFALVLPGAVARGAYEAGVIQALTEQDTRIDRIVATSSGALNGLAYARGICGGNEIEMADKLVESWIENGGWDKSLSLSPFELLTGRGLSTSAGLLKMMRAMITPCPKPRSRDVELRVLVTPLNGVLGAIAGRPATTYERIIKFTGEDFTSEEKLERVFKVVCAACAFPGLFQPVELDGLGACVDGGAVNNAPIKYALEESDVNRVMMPIPFPAVMKPGDWNRGMGLLNHLIAILINERLFRDLRDAQNVNAEADRLRALVESGELSEEQLAKINSILSVRKVEITEIRPNEALQMSPFSGFFKKRDHIGLVAAGKKAALDALSAIPTRALPT